ncbi:hypothetical protein SGRIM128S_06393 [Streptomyces griseomycini]
MQFRQQALARLQSPEELDLPVRFARPQGWLVLSVTVVAMAAASVWAVTGSVPSTVGAPAVLTHGQGSYVLQSPVSGQVTAVLARQGERLPAYSPVLKVRTEQGDTVVRTLDAGRVTALAAGVGQIIRTGADVAAVEKVADAGCTRRCTSPPRAPPPSPPTPPWTSRCSRCPARSTACCTASLVGRSAQSAQQIAAFLGDSQLGRAVHERGQTGGRHGRAGQVVRHQERLRVVLRGRSAVPADLDDPGHGLRPAGRPASRRLAAAVTTAQETRGRRRAAPPRRKVPTPRAKTVRTPTVSRWRPWSAAPPPWRWCLGHYGRHVPLEELRIACGGSATVAPATC